MKLSKWKTLPIHHIDTSVVIENPRTENGFYCKKYLNLVGLKFRGRFSIPMLGEYLLFALSLKSYSDQIDALEIVEGLVRKNRIEFSTTKNIDKIANEIAELDKRLETTDRLIVASVIVDNASKLVTLDRNLIHNQSLESNFKIRIAHPRDLV